MRAALLSLPLVLTAACATVPPVHDPSTVLLVDEQERQMVASSDVASLERLAHPNLRINAPTGRVLSREQFLANVRSGAIAAEAFERTPEEVTISGNVAVVMGRETFTPVADSELGRAHGTRPLQRRYTNVYVWQDGRWMWLARHANIHQSTPTRHTASQEPNPSPEATACEPANGREGTPGCWVLATAPVISQPAPVYWHVYELDSAEQAQGSGQQSRAISAHGRTWLVTVAGQEWKAPSGRHVASVGPLELLSAQPHTASFMEATFTPGMSSRVHTHPGPEAWVVLEGEQCLETPEGVIRGNAGSAMKVRGGIPMQLFGTGTGVRKALVLILHPTGQQLGRPHHHWRPAGTCTGG